MFNDKFRFFKIIIPLLIILMTIFYGEIKGPKVYPGFIEAIKAPELYIDQEISFGGQVIEIQNNYLMVKINREVVRVNLVLPRESLNYQISGMAVFQKDQSLTPSKYHLSNLRIYKIYLSLIPLSVITYLFFKKYYA